MKSFYLFSLLCCAALFQSCSSEFSESSSLSGEARELTFTASDFKYDPSSRTSLIISNEGAEFSWSANDTVGIFPNEGTQVGFSMAAGAGTKTASFDGGGWSLKSASTYAAYYPLRGEFYLDKRVIPLDYTGQTQTGNASTAHLGAYDYMGAVAKTPEEGRVTFDFQHLGALVQLNIPLEEACSLDSVVLHTDDASFVTEGSLDLTSSSLAVTAKKNSKNFSVSLKDMSFSEPNQTATVYFMLSPVDLSGKEIDAIVYRGNGAMPLKYVFSGQNFEAGLAYSVIASFSTAQDNVPAGVEAVDLGLPSGIKWASCNVGATKPEEYGGYYAWGETEEKDNYSWDTYKYYNKESAECVFIGNDISGTEYDVAHVKWGGSWRMPTLTEIDELIDKCTWTWTTYNGVTGYKIIGPNENSIFLPATGYYWDLDIHGQGTVESYYWSGTLSGYSYAAYSLDFCLPFHVGDHLNYKGHPVRPVSE